MAFKVDDQIRRRVADDTVVWLTTVTKTGRPAPRPVWFVWDETAFMVYSNHEALKVRHIAANPEVALNFNSTPLGSDVIVINGTAQLDRDAPPPSQAPLYRAKYDEHITVGLGMTHEEFDAGYGQAIRIAPAKSWGFPQT